MTDTRRLVNCWLALCTIAAIAEAGLFIGMGGF